MTPRKASLSLIGPALVMLLSCSSMPIDRTALPDSAQIEAARSEEDHNALATRFEHEAQRARTEAREHRALGTAYEKGPQYRWIDVVGVDTGMPAMPRHCELLARNAEERARLYSEMAQQHRLLGQRRAGDQQ